MEILERGPVLLELSHLLHRASAGCGQLVFLGGESGIGKTALVRRFRDLVRDTADGFVGSCDPLSTPRPLGPIIDIAAHLDRSRWAELLEGRGERDSVFRDFLAELSRVSRPRVVVIEDVHWADEATLDLLRFLGRRIETSTALLIATYRSDEVSDGHPLRTVLGDLATASSVSRIDIGPLSPEAVAALAAGSDLNSRELHRLTGGNPFFVTEVLAAKSPMLPPTVRDAVLARASRLPLESRSLLEAAAVIGARVEPWLLERVSPGAAPALDACVAMGMLQSSGSTYAFRHELAREAIAEATSPSRRMALHRAVLDALQSRPGGSVSSARLGYHAECAGDGDAVLRYAPEAAGLASELGAHREAAAQYRRALRFADDLPLEERALLLEKYSFECGTTSQYNDAIRADYEIVAIWRKLGNRAKEGWALNFLASCLVSIGRNAEAEAANREAIAVLEALPPGKELAEVYAGQAGLRMLNRDNAEAIEWARKSLAIAEPNGYTYARILAYNRLGASLLLMGDEAGRQYLERSADLARGIGTHWTVALAFVNLGSVAGERFELERAERYLDEGIEYAEAHELDSNRLYMLAWRAQTRLHLGRWNEAHAAALQVTSRRDAQGTARMVALAALGRLLTRRGDPAAAAALDELLTIALPTGTLQRIAPARAARAEAAWLAGDLARVREEARAALPLAMEHRHPWFAGELLSWLKLGGGDVVAPEWIASPFALQIAGQWDSAANEWERLGCPYESAFALTQSGDPEAIRSALATFERLGAVPAAQLATRRLRELGERMIPRGPRPSTRSNPGRLTRREVEVVQLLSEGLQNATIASRLFLSPKTVDHHVSAVLTKLGVRTRTEAAREARRLGILQDGETGLAR